MSSSPRRARTAAAVVAVATLALTGCANGFDAATNIVYVPADGISLDTDTVDVRNLTLVADPDQPVELSATLVNTTNESDRLVGAQLGDASGSLAGGGQGVQVTPKSALVLGSEGGPVITFPGTAQLGSWLPVTLQFERGGTVSGSALVTTSVPTPPSAAADHGEESLEGGAGH